MSGQTGEQAPRLDPAARLDERRGEGILEALVVEPAHLVLDERAAGPLVGGEHAERPVRFEPHVGGKCAEGGADRDGEHSPEVDEQRPDGVRSGRGRLR